MKEQLEKLSGNEILIELYGEAVWVQLLNVCESHIEVARVVDNEEIVSIIPISALRAFSYAKEPSQSAR